MPTLTALCDEGYNPFYDNGGNMLKGKTLSILGDSISTYQGISNNGDIRPELFYNAVYYREPFPLEKTYWMRVMEALGLTLAVNNSYSGGNLSGRENEFSGVNRAKALGGKDGNAPDFIILFMGLNDLGRNVPLSVFADDYQKTLNTVSALYPLCRVCCVNLPDRDIFLRERTVLFNEAIASAVSSAGENFFIADLFSSRLKGDFYYNNTIDGLHPDEDGMKYIAEVITEAFRSNAE